MKDSLPSQVLNEKLPWFLQKCTQTFDSDHHYKNDLQLVFYFFFFFFFFHFLLDDFDFGLLGFLEVV